MVADCSRYDSPDLLLDYGEQLAAASTSPCQVFDLGSDSEEEEAKPKQNLTSELAAQESSEDGSVTAGGGLQQFLDDIMEGRVRPLMTEKELETKVAELLARNRTKPPELNLVPTDGHSKKKYLIFTTGCLTYSPHQIGKPWHGGFALGYAFQPLLLPCPGSKICHTGSASCHPVWSLPCSRPAAVLGADRLALVSTMGFCWGASCS